MSAVALKGRAIVACAFADDERLAWMHRTFTHQFLILKMHYAVVSAGFNATIGFEGSGRLYVTRDFPDLGSLRAYLLERLPGIPIDLCCACFNDGRFH